MSLVRAFKSLLMLVTGDEDAATENINKFKPKFQDIIEIITDDRRGGCVKLLIVLNVTASAALLIASFRRFIGLFT